MQPLCIPHFSSCRIAANLAVRHPHIRLQRVLQPCRAAPTAEAATPMRSRDDEDDELKLTAEEQALLEVDEPPAGVEDSDEPDDKELLKDMEVLQGSTIDEDEWELDDGMEVYAELDEEELRSLAEEPVDPDVGLASTSYAMYDEDDDKESRTFATAMAKVASDTKGGDIMLLHVAPLVYWTSYMLVVTVFSRPQLNAVLARMEKEASQSWERVLPQHKKPGRGLWEVLDYGDVVVHVMAAEEREYYDIESFYGAAEEVDLPFLQEEAALGPQWKTKV